jgi:hypothetical protein
MDPILRRNLDGVQSLTHSNPALQANRLRRSGLRPEEKSWQSESLSDNTEFDWSIDSPGDDIEAGNDRVLHLTASHKAVEPDQCSRNVAKRTGRVRPVAPRNAHQCHLSLKHRTPAEVYQDAGRGSDYAEEGRDHN